MIPLLQLKKEVQLNTELGHILDALKGIAAARYHLLERQSKGFESYFQEASEFASLLDLKEIRHPFLQPAGPKVLAVLVTSDAGFLGGLNTRVMAAGLAQIPFGGSLAIIGERGTNALRGGAFPMKSFPGIEEQHRQKLALEVRDHLVEEVLQGRCGKVVVVYPKPVSFSFQQAVVETLLPCQGWFEETQRTRFPSFLVFESRPEDLLEYLVSQWVGERLLQIFALSRLAEWAARVVHLEGGYQELLGRGKKLKLQYFRARHEWIDRSMREISSQLLYGKEE